jgi:hypothetical protein
VPQGTNAAAPAVRRPLTWRVRSTVRLWTGQGRAGRTGTSGTRTSRWGTFPRRSRTTRSAWRLPRSWATGRGEGTPGNSLGNSIEENGDLPAAARSLVHSLAEFQGVEGDLGAHDNRRVSLLSSSKRPMSCCRVVLLGLGQQGWALGVAAQAKARRAPPGAPPRRWQRRRRERRRRREERSVRGGVRRVVGRGAGACARPGRRRRWQRAVRPRVLAAV